MSFRKGEDEVDIETIDYDDLFNLSESESEDEVVPRKRFKNTIDEKLYEVGLNQVKNRLTTKSSRDVIGLLNSMPGSSVTIPNRRYLLKEVALNMTNLTTLYFLFCDSCDELVEEGQNCECGAGITKKNLKKSNFIVYFQLLPQIEQILKENFAAIMEYLHRERSESAISDIDDGTLFKEFSAANTGSEILSLTMNVDGARIYNTSSNSLWPVQFYLNFLPPSIRYLSKNIVVTTLFYGVHKPDMDKLLFPTAKELDTNDYRIKILATNNEIINFVIDILISCDLPARAAVQNFIGCTGKFGCPFCYHPGEPVVNNSGKSKTIRYKQQLNIKNRTHDETISVYKVNKQMPKKGIYGIKGPSPALMFRSINIIQSFPIDFMHGELIGITKDLVEIWMGKKKIPETSYSAYKLKPPQKETLKRRILGLKPHSSWRRKPRSIFELANFKASELLNMLWFYLRYTIPGLLPTRVVKHFEKLSAATYILCQDVITKEEVKFACDLLIEFADEFEQIYGPGAVTMNIHLIRHFFTMVTNCGPLWAYCLFAAENNIGVLKRLITGNGHVLEQLAKKYPISKSIKPAADEANKFGLKDQTVLHISGKWLEALSKAGVTVTQPFEIWRRYIRNKENITSSQYVQERSCDNFVILKDDRIGIVQFYFKIEERETLLLKLYDKICTNYHWVEVCATNEYAICPCSDIARKVLYFETFGANFISRIPNCCSKAVC